MIRDLASCVTFTWNSKNICFTTKLFAHPTFWRNCQNKRFYKKNKSCFFKGAWFMPDDSCTFPFPREFLVELTKPWKSRKICGKNVRSWRKKKSQKKFFPVLMIYGTVWRRVLIEVVLSRATNAFNFSFQNLWKEKKTIFQKHPFFRRKLTESGKLWLNHTQDYVKRRLRDANLSVDIGELIILLHDTKYKWNERIRIVNNDQWICALNN